MAWQLERVTDALETSTKSDGTVEERDVRTVVRYQKHYGASFSSSVGDYSSSITWNVGTLTHVKVLTGGKRYKCVSDELGGIEHPTKYGTQTQTWVYVSAFRDALNFED